MKAIKFFLFISLSTLSLTACFSTSPFNALVEEQKIPMVLGVSSSSANGSYSSSSTVTVTVTFTEPVYVTGSPYLILETGSTDRNAVYSTGAGTSVLSFTYTVQSGDSSSDLDYVSSSALVAVGASIKNVNGVDANLRLPAPGFSGSLGANKEIVIAASGGSSSVVGTGVLSYAKSFGGASIDYIRSLAVDSSGNVHVCGAYTGTVDFDPGAGTTNLTSVSVDIFFAKYDSSGNLVWAKSVGSASDSVCYGIAVDTSGNVFITGEFRSTADFDPDGGTSNLVSGGQTDAFLAKYNSSGALQWANRFGSGMGVDDRGDAIVLDSSGNPVITGRFENTVDFDPGAGTTSFASGGGTDIFLAQYDSAGGSMLFAKQIGGAGTDNVLAIKIDSTDSIYIAGEFNGAADFDPDGGTTTLTSVGTFDGFFAKYDSTGALTWAKQISGSGATSTNAIGIDGSSNVYVGGHFDGTADFDPSGATQNLTAPGGCCSNGDAYFAKYDSSGNYVWANQIESSNFTSSEVVNSIAVDSSGNFYITGAFEDTADFDPSGGTTNLVSNGFSEIFIAQYDSSGTLGWAHSIGSAAGEDYGSAIAIDSAGASYIAGRFTNAPDFDPGAGTTTLTSGGSSDAFFMKLD